MAQHFKELSLQNSDFAQAKLIEAFGDEFQYLEDLKERFISFENKSESFEFHKAHKFEDYKAKKYILREAFKLIKIVFLHRYEIYIK